MPNRLFLYNDSANTRYELDVVSYAVLNSENPSSNVNGLGVSGERLYDTLYPSGALCREIDKDTFAVLNSGSSPGSFTTDIGGTSDRLYAVDIGLVKTYEIDKDTFAVLNSGSTPTSDSRGVGGTFDSLYVNGFNTKIVYKVDKDTLAALENSSGVNYGTQLFSVGGSYNKLFIGADNVQYAYEISTSDYSVLNSIGTIANGSVTGIGATKESPISPITISNPSKTSSSLYLTWDNLASANYFKLYYKTSYSGEDYTLEADDITGIDYYLSTLRGNTSYDIKIEGYDGTDTLVAEGETTLLKTDRREGMSEKRTGATSSTKNNIILGAGVVYIKKTGASDYISLGATRGGGGFENGIPMRAIDFDGSMGNTKGFVTKDKGNPTLSATILELSKENLNYINPGSKIVGDTMISNGQIKDTDYIEEVKWVGYRVGTCDPVTIKVKNALQTEPVAFAFVDNDEATIALTFSGHFDLTDAVDADGFLPEPWEIIDGAE